VRLFAWRWRLGSCVEKGSGEEDEPALAVACLGY
jgi:hypothetical protein